MRWLLKRWWFWAGAGFMLVAVCAGYLLIPVGEDRISQASCDRIQKGWSPKQVESLLGKATVAFEPTGSTIVMGEQGMASPDFVMLWNDDDGNTIQVFFDKLGDNLGVTEKGWAGLPIMVRTKRRIERRIKALWP
jgi:hypothetical protein